MVIIVCHIMSYCLFILKFRKKLYKSQNEILKRGKLKGSDSKFLWGKLKWTLIGRDSAIILLVKGLPPSLSIMRNLILRSIRHCKPWIPTVWVLQTAWQIVSKKTKAKRLIYFSLKDKILLIPSKRQLQLI